MKQKQIKFNDEFKTFIIKNTVFATAITFLLGYQIRIFINTLVDTIIEPLFSIDLNNDGKSDLKQLKKISQKMFGVNFPLGKLILEFSKTILTILIIYLIVKLLTRYTDLI